MILKENNIILNTLSQEVFEDSKEIFLTRKEYQILRLLFRFKHKLVTKDKVNSVVFNGLYTMGNQANVHISGIRKKLTNKNLIHTIKTGYGWMLKYKGYEKH